MGGGGVRAIDGAFRRGGGERERQRRDRGAVDAWLAKGGTDLSLEARFSWRGNHLGWEGQRG